MDSKGSRRPTLVLVPAPFQGHITPMLQLGYILESKGFSIVVAHAEYNAPNPENHPGFVFRCLPDNTSDMDRSFMKLLPVLTAINDNCKAPLQDYLVEVMEEEELQGGGVACIIYDNIMYFVDEVGKELKLPTVIMRPNNVGYILAQFAVLSLHAQYSLPLPESQLEETVPTLQPFKFKDLPFPPGMFEVPEIIVQFWENTFGIGSSRAIIWNSMVEFEDLLLPQLQETYRVPSFFIGPFNKFAPPSQTSLQEEDDSCLAWLDKQAPNSVLYVSQGSLASMDEEELIETAWGLVNSDQLFLWVVRHDSVNGSSWTERLSEDLLTAIEERGWMVNWAPQKKVLANPAVAGFWSHCGWNSTLESISEGVPMICGPHFSDQRVNSKYVTDILKVGLEAPSTLEREGIERTIRRLMVDIEGKEMKKRALDMKRKLDALVAKGGASERSLNDLTEFISSLNKGNP